VAPVQRREGVGAARMRVAQQLVVGGLRGEGAHGRHLYLYSAGAAEKFQVFARARFLLQME
jgi:hypothetical protein